MLFCVNQKEKVYLKTIRETGHVWRLDETLKTTTFVMVCQLSSNLISSFFFVNQ